MDAENLHRRNAIHGVIPRLATVLGDPEAFTRSHPNVAGVVESNVPHDRDERGQARRIPIDSIIQGDEKGAARCRRDVLSARVNGNEATLALYGASAPGRALVAALQQADRGGCIPLAGTDMNIGDARCE